MSEVSYINRELQEIAADLPKSYATRWSASRKAAVVRAVQAGVISLNGARERYRLSRSEFKSWQQNFAARGEQGLRAKQLQLHR